jgi:hypothetical protein
MAKELQEDIVEGETCVKCGSTKFFLYHVKEEFENSFGIDRSSEFKPKQVQREAVELVRKHSHREEEDECSPMTFYDQAREYCYRSTEEFVQLCLRAKISMKSGATRAEMITELIKHVDFYCGCPDCTEFLPKGARKETGAGLNNPEENKYFC